MAEVKPNTGNLPGPNLLNKGMPGVHNRPIGAALRHGP